MLTALEKNALREVAEAGEKNIFGYDWSEQDVLEFAESFAERKIHPNSILWYAAKVCYGKALDSRDADLAYRFTMNFLQEAE